jgi:hypothetical protein
MLIEAAGLLVVATAHGPATAIAGACLTGFGFALVFPSLGSMVVDRGGAKPGHGHWRLRAFPRRLAQRQRPAAGWAAGSMGFSAPFYLSALAAVVAAGGAWALRHRAA